MKNYIMIVSIILISIFSFAKANAATFSCGADVSWLPQMEAKGYKFYDDNGVQKDCLQILKEHGINSIRLRVWVNPSNDPYSGHCSKAETVALAKRCADMGFRIMIDFHYSDSWADPGKQYKPAAWQNHNFTQLKADVYEHTTDVLNALKSAGVTPEWVQVGNETNNGMLWEDGKASVNMKNLAQLVSSGYDGVKAVFPQAKVIVHISNGYDNSLFRWIFDGLKNNGGKYDVIGMSLYPEQSNYLTLNSQCLTNMNDMVSRYGKEVMICEVGMDNYLANDSKNFISDIIKKVRSVSGGKGLGVFYWEPQCYNWAGYGKGAWSTNGRPTIAMDAFLEANVGLDSSRSINGYIKGEGFRVEVEGTEHFAISDINGLFVIKDIKSSLKEITLKIYKPGFLTRSIDISFPQDRYTISVSDQSNPIILMEGDMNNNGVINMEDVIMIAKVFGLTSSHTLYNAAADFNNDGIINMADIIMLAKNFGKTYSDYTGI